MKNTAIRMQTRRVTVSSADWEEVLSANPQRKYLRIAISAGLGLLPTNPGVVQLAFDSKGEEYLLVWVIRPFEPAMAPCNKLLLRAQKDAPGDDDVEVLVEITEGIEVGV